MYWPPLACATSSNGQIFIAADAYWPVAELRALRERCERDGLALEGQRLQQIVRRGKHGSIRVRA
jgi:hypothetical protein